MGNEIGKFTKVYNDNIEDQSTEVVENDLVCQTLKILVELEDYLPDSPSEFYTTMRNHAEKYLNLSKFDNKRFPSSPKALTDHLKRFEVDLRKHGILIIRDKVHSGRTIEVRKDRVKIWEKTDNAQQQREGQMSDQQKLFLRHAKILKLSMILSSVTQ
jgi:hypothetical protein